MLSTIVAKTVVTKRAKADLNWTGVRQGFSEYYSCSRLKLSLCMTKHCDNCRKMLKNVVARGLLNFCNSSLQRNHNVYSRINRRD